jgi:hypothetical protein
MTSDLEEILLQLRELEAQDFDYTIPGAHGLERLNEICEAVEKLARPSSAFPAMFELMERLSESELGTPGPLVHTMESQSGSYEGLLEESVKRKPVDLSVWMVNRILNAECDRARWMSILQLSAEHTQASELVRDQAKHFIEFQNAKAKSA